MIINGVSYIEKGSHIVSQEREYTSSVFVGVASDCM